MWGNLIVFHSEKKERDNVVFDGLLPWRTCMRTVYIGDSRLTHPEDFMQTAPYQLFMGYEAYSLLLEIISGLKSKLLGETEVLAQFKENFKQSNLPDTPLGEYIGNLKDDLIEDSRKIRSTHLIGLGDQSYGGITHRLLGKTEKVTLVGTGQLAEKVLPWAMQTGREVTVIGRNIERLKHLSEKFGVNSEILSNKINYEEGLIICAPLEIKSKLESIPQNSKIIDLRDNSFGEKYSVESNYISFLSILDTLKENEERNRILRNKLDFIVSKIVEEREHVSINHIYCWEDIPCSVF